MASSVEGALTFTEAVFGDGGAGVCGDSVRSSTASRGVSLASGNFWRVGGRWGWG